jgi:hypothetical protein
MMWMSPGRFSAASVAVVAVLGVSQAAQAEDFFSALFGGFNGGRAQAPSINVPFANDGPTESGAEPRPRRIAGSGQAFCVRTCDGRYFPLATGDSETRAASCNNFCPASETKVVYGGSIDQAATKEGKPYSELPNAFRYRNELVAGCTCNGKNQVGLAPVKIDNDPTLRKGDIVAGADGLMVSRGGADKRGATNFSPVSSAIAAKYDRLPVVAAD